MSLYGRIRSEEPPPLAVFDFPFFGDHGVDGMQDHALQIGAFDIGFDLLDRSTDVAGDQIQDFSAMGVKRRTLRSCEMMTMATSALARKLTRSLLTRVSSSFRASSSSLMVLSSSLLD